MTWHWPLKQARQPGIYFKTIWMEPGQFRWLWNCLSPYFPQRKNKERSLIGQCGHPEHRYPQRSGKSILKVSSKLNWSSFLPRFKFPIWLLPHLNIHNLGAQVHAIVVMGRMHDIVLIIVMKCTVMYKFSRAIFYVTAVTRNVNIHTIEVGVSHSSSMYR